VSLAGAVVVVTGGTGALGRSLVLRLLADEARVAVPWMGETGWQALRTSAGEKADLWGDRVDVADSVAMQQFTDEAARRWGRLDGLAAIAGGYAGSATLELAPIQEWDSMLRSNLLTVYSACRAVLPHLVARGGSVVTVGSRAAEAGRAGAAAYTVAKAGVHSLTRVLALENRDRGVRFNCVLPGTIDTPANREALPHADTSSWTSPDAIAKVITFLLSPDSAPVTGALVPVDACA
jgi:NAD(P)-dependent dehydrogenase (short-subunit alcohol dehydrogenase family)